MSETLVRNVADPGQVAEADRKERFTRKQELDDMREVLSSRAGRRVIWKMLSFCKVFESIWHASALIHYSAGQQDVGHYLLSEVNEADPNSLVTMMSEAKGK